MTIRTFQNQCTPGCRVLNRQSNGEGTVIKINRDRSRALVHYQDHSVEWNEYYLLDFPEPNTRQP